jgi:hypothetical protein
MAFFTRTTIPIGCIGIHMGSIHTEDTTTVTMVDTTMVITAAIMAMAGIGTENSRRL